jgi:outer membrane protein W
MTYRKLLGGLVLLLAAVFAQPAAAQSAGSYTWNLQYSTVLPTGDATKSYTEGFSWRGATIDFRRFSSDQLALGLSAGWHVMDDKDAGTYQFENGAVTGTAYKYVNAVPVLATATYFAGSPRGNRPFLGAGAGTYYIKNRTEAGIFAIDDSNWHLGLMAEAGVFIPRPDGIGDGTGIMLSARYNWALKSNDIERQYLTFSIGIQTGS